MPHANLLGRDVSAIRQWDTIELVAIRIIRPWHLTESSVCRRLGDFVFPPTHADDRREC